MRKQSAASRAMLVSFCALVAAIAYLQHPQAARQASVQSPRPVSLKAAADAPSTTATRPDAVFAKYCVGCHNSKTKTAGLSLDALDATNVAAHSALWEKIASKLRTQEMPPPGRPRPDAETYGALVTQLETALDTAAAANPNPGRVAVHRLNRSEYTAAIRDLFGLEIDGKALLAADEADQEGFDNVASVLSVSPALLENYLSAARTISRLAVGDTTLNPVVDTFKISKALFQDEQMSDDLPFGSRGGALIRHYFPLDGEYSIKVLLRRQEYDYIIGMGEPHELDIRVDGALVKRFSVGGEAKGMTAPENFAGNTQGDPAFEQYMHTADAKLEARVPVKAGQHDVGVSFVRRLWEPEGVWQPPQTGFGRTTNEYYYGNPAVEIVMIGGPYGQPAPGDSLVRRRLFVCRPAGAASTSTKPGADEPCARKILSTLATRAYRRPLTEQDLQIVLEFYRAGREEAGFDAGIQRAVERILAAPSFLFRVEHPPANAAGGSVYRLSDVDLASRLSFFLWGSIPDDELLNVAVHGKLKDPAVLEQQVQRMLRDDRSDALVNNFASRWLELSKIAGVVPDTDLYREFDENLRDAMDKETRLFVGDQLRNDRGAMELLTANYSFLNQRLANHYGIPNVYGDHFRKVTFADGKRGGLVGQGSILTVTSYGNRTSVVMRGRWVLANLLGAPPAEPPADVPALKEAGMDGAPRSLRERMEVHRKNPVCASCHMRMDPIGFSLENFDATGKWRVESDGAPIDPAAFLPDGTKFEGVAGLRAMLVSHKEDFVRTVSGKLLSYAIGRGLESYDLPAVRKIARDAAKNDYRWSSIIAGIVTSTPFSMGIARGEESQNRQPATGVARR
jgi:mono/diheme cytochrome c family protein